VNSKLKTVLYKNFVKEREHLKEMILGRRSSGCLVGWAGESFYYSPPDKIAFLHSSTATFQGILIYIPPS
jgi:hypothetical protein